MKDIVKDLFLSLFDPQTLNEAITQVIKCDNQIFQSCQDQNSWTPIKEQMIHHASFMSTNIPTLHLKVINMQIDTIHIKHLTLKKNKRHMEEGLSLYYGERSHKVISYLKKPSQRTIKTRGAII